MVADNFGAYIVNETAAKDFGWKDPIGKKIWGPMGTDRDEGEVIGVIRDFNFASLHNKIEPLIIFPIAEGWGIEYVYVKVNPIRPSNLISQIEAEYKKAYSHFPMEWEYLDSKYQSLYKEDYEIRDIFQVGLGDFHFCFVPWHIQHIGVPGDRTGQGNGYQKSYWRSSASFICTSYEAFHKIHFHFFPDCLACYLLFIAALA